MSIEEIEAEALKLDPKSRARLAGRLLESLEELSDAENEQVWVKEAQRRDREMDENPSSTISAAEALQDARAKLR